MTKKTKFSAFSFEGFVITESHIVRNPKEQGVLNVDINPSGEYIIKEKSFNLTLEIKVYDDNSSFEAIIKTQSSFKFKENVDEKDLHNYFYVNASAIVFPYIRSYISALTALSGLKTVTIPTMNLIGLSNQLKDNTEIIK